MGRFEWLSRGWWWGSDRGETRIVGISETRIVGRRGEKCIPHMISMHIRAICASYMHICTGRITDVVGLLGPWGDSDCGKARVSDSGEAGPIREWYCGRRARQSRLGWRRPRPPSHPRVSACPIGESDRGIPAPAPAAPSARHSDARGSCACQRLGARAPRTLLACGPGLRGLIWGCNRRTPRG